VLVPSPESECCLRAKDGDLLLKNKPLLLKNKELKAQQKCASCGAHRKLCHLLLSFLDPKFSTPFNGYGLAVAKQKFTLIFLD